MYSNNMQNNMVLMSIKELAQMLCVKEAGIRQWIQLRQIPFLKIGRLIRFDPKEIQVWIESKKVGTVRWTT